MRLIKLARLSIGAGLNLLCFFSPRRAGELAFRIFARPPKPKIRPKEAAFLETAQRLDFSFEGSNIAVYGWGGEFPLEGSSTEKTENRPLILLAYGWGYNAGRWRYFVPPLVEAGYRVLAFDPPGHGYSDFALLEYPKMVRLQLALIHRFGRAERLLGHSFGGGCFVGTLAQLPQELHPTRVCLMGIFSEARWIFRSYKRAIGMGKGAYFELTRAIQRRTGRRLSTFDNARLAADLEHIECLFLHDPADETTSFSNAVRNHSYWPGSALYRASGAGHHLSTADTTRIVMDWLIKGFLPESVSLSEGLTDADHELRRFFLNLELDTVHGKMRSDYL